MITTKSIPFIKCSLILALVLVISGCSHQPISEEESRHQMLEEMRACLKKIPDPNRRKQLSALMNTLQQDLAELSQTVDKFGTDAQRLNANYDATEEDFRELLDNFNTTRKRLQQEILTSHFKMKELTTADEWEDLAELEEKALTKILRQNLLDRQDKEV